MANLYTGYAKFTSALPVIISILLSSWGDGEGERGGLGLSSYAHHQSILRLHYKGALIGESWC
jgi:hypothetical protein